MPASRVAECGSHAELLAKPEGAYRRLVESELGGARGRAAVAS